MNGVRIPPFCDLEIHFATSLSEIKGEYPDNVYQCAKEHSESGCYGCALHAKGGTSIPEIGGMLVVVFLDNLKADEKNGVKLMGTISHEMVHIATAVLEHIGAMPKGIEDSEVLAHLQGWLLQEFLEYLGYE